MYIRGGKGGRWGCKYEASRSATGKRRPASNIFTCSVRNYRSPGRHWRLTFRVGDHHLRLGRQKKKQKKEKKSSSRESFAKKAGRSGASILSSIIPLRFDRERNTDRETPTCHARCSSTEQYSAEPAQQVLSTRAVARSTTKRQNYTMSQYTSTSELESRFTFLTLLRRERRRTDPERTFFLSVSVRSRTRHGLRNSHLSRACEALQRCVFSHFSFHTCGGEN